MQAIARHLLVVIGGGLGADDVRAGGGLRIPLHIRPVRSSAGDTRVLGVGAVFVAPKAIGRAAVQPALGSRAFHLVEPDRAGALAILGLMVIRAARQPQLPAHDLRVVIVPDVVAHGAPPVVVVDLDTPLAGRAALQPHLALEHRAGLRRAPLDLDAVLAVLGKVDVVHGASQVGSAADAAGAQVVGRRGGAVGGGPLSDGDGRDRSRDVRVRRRRRGRGRWWRRRWW